MMKVIDGHCDALYKLYENEELDFYGTGDEPGLDVTYSRLCEANVRVQFFAIYLPERITDPRFDHYLEYVSILNRGIRQHDRMRLIRTRSDLIDVMHGPQRGALLTLEGADALGGNSLYLRTLYDLGVRMIGPTWNYGNWAADGILEPRKGGFSRRGKSFIKECNELGILLDASHLSVASFWDLAECSAVPFVATHSNAKAVCGHPRNLDDDQLKELIRRDGRIGLTFVPWFVQGGGQASIEALLRHVDYVLSLGGEGQLVFGSDFDGIDQWIPGLEHPGGYVTLANELYKRYPAQLVEKLLYGNWQTYLQQHLPIY
ncbi:dipeptidase [Paenibacillus sp. YYML68]|uniref:dipeptidase n=1 Tax=Paenibacillus sp. YYML68 TaxID=2909250 RepID=UPI0024932569|nr:dipeptidase [Paenibacillus sp. YYML68]